MVPAACNEFIREAKIEPRGRVALLGVEASELIRGQACSPEVKVTIPDDLDQNNAALDHHLVFFGRVGLRFWQNVTYLKHRTIGIYSV